jgi:hypothetical protein
MLSESRCGFRPLLRDSDHATFPRDAHSGAIPCAPLPGYLLRRHQWRKGHDRPHSDPRSKLGLFRAYLCKKTMPRMAAKSYEKMSYTTSCGMRLLEAGLDGTWP